MQTLVIFDAVELSKEEADAMKRHLDEQARVHGRVLYLGSPWPDKGIFSQLKEGSDVSPVPAT